MASECLRAEVCVVGAGAAGLWAAAVAARRGARVLLLEKTSRTGTKVLASGGTRCNLTTTLSPEAAARTFRRQGERFLRHAFRVLPPLAVRERFARLGVETVEAPLDKVFPRSDRARDVRDALEREARASGARILLATPAAGVARAADGWEVALADGRSVACRVLFLCSGGASYPRSGTTGEGYLWLEALGLPLVPRVPALVPLSSPAEWVRALAGISCQDCEARLVDARGEELARRRRPLLFTHRGVSGPAAMDPSVHVARAQLADPGARLALVVDLLPDVERAGLRERLVEVAGRRGSPGIAAAFEDRVPRRLLAAVAAQADLPAENPRAAQLTRAQRHALVEASKGLRIPIDGTLGYEHAEVTSGGLALDAVDPGTMRVRGERGLHVFGELLDLDGPIGGLSFQAAFACAELAGRSVEE